MRLDSCLTVPKTAIQLLSNAPPTFTIKSNDEKSTYKVCFGDEMDFVVAHIGTNTVYPASTCVPSFIIMLPSTAGNPFQHFTGLVPIFV